MADGLTLREDLGQGLGTEHVSEGCGYEKVGRVGVVADVADRGQGIGDLVEAYCVDAHCHGVAGQHLLGRDLVGYRTEINTSEREREKQKGFISVCFPNVCVVCTYAGGGDVVVVGRGGWDKKERQTLIESGGRGLFVPLIRIEPKDKGEENSSTHTCDAEFVGKQKRRGERTAPSQTPLFCVSKDFSKPEKRAVGELDREHRLGRRFFV